MVAHASQNTQTIQYETQTQAIQSQSHTQHNPDIDQTQTTKIDYVEPENTKIGGKLT